MARADAKRPEAVLMPPDLSRLGMIAFSGEEHEALATWLVKPEWPKGSMDITTLNGYLTAFVVWPIELPPGAWLPAIWNDSGWRVPEPIRSSLNYQRFITLIVGYLQEIDRGLSAASPIYTPTLRADTRLASPAVPPAIGWAMGFHRALALGVSGVVARSALVMQAVQSIARFLSAPDGSARSRLDPGALLTQAVLALASERSSRGPLGGLYWRRKGS